MRLRRQVAIAVKRRVTKHYRFAACCRYGKCNAGAIYTVDSCLILIDVGVHMDVIVLHAHNVRDILSCIAHNYYYYLPFMDGC